LYLSLKITFHFNQAAHFLGGFSFYMTDYVKCTRCEHWPDERRHKEVCQGCNNTSQAVDPKSVLCNMCGECARGPEGTHNQYPLGLEKITIGGGYSSYHLFDMTEYTFNLCEKCIRQLFMQFKIKPHIYSSIGYGEETWESDQSCYEFRLWKDAGGHHQAYLNGKCNAVKDCPHDAVYTLLHNDTEFTEDALCEEHKELKYSNSKLTKFISNNLKPFL
jgi:hypothetical protein